MDYAGTMDYAMNLYVYTKLARIAVTYLNFYVFWSIQVHVGTFNSLATWPGSAASPHGSITSTSISQVGGHEHLIQCNHQAI